MDINPADYEPWMFSDEQFVKLNWPLYQRYVKYKVEGWSEVKAFGYAFKLPFDTTTIQRITHLESTDAYREEFQRQMDAMDPNKMWNRNISVHNLVRLINDPEGRDSTKLAAIKELNVMFAITIVDENGKTRAGASLEDFYKGMEKRGMDGKQVVPQPPLH